MNNSDGLPKLLLSEEDHNLSRERLAKKTQEIEMKSIAG